MPNVFLNPIQKKFLLKFFLTAFENRMRPIVFSQITGNCILANKRKGKPITSATITLGISNWLKYKATIPTQLK